MSTTNESKYNEESGIKEECVTIIHENHYQPPYISVDSSLNQIIGTSDKNSVESNSISYEFRDGSFMTRSIIEPELETYFKGGSAWPSGILIMANVCLGMGILNFPRIVYEAGGILPTIVIIMVFVILIAGSLYITAYCCRYYACVNYQDMVRVHCGQFFGTLCTVMLFIEITGSLIVKMVVLADQLDRFYSIATGDSITKTWYLMPTVAIAAFLPMCFIRDFSCFKYVSIGGVLAALYITFGVAMGGYYTLGPADPELFRETPDAPREFTLLLPLLVYGYHGHVEAPLVFSGLKKQKLHQFMRTVYSYLFIATLCYVVTAVFGYLTFGKSTNVDFLLNYPINNWLANAAIIIVSFKIFTSFPVLFFVDRSVFNIFYMTLIRMITKSQIRFFFEKHTVARFIQTIVIFILIIILAAVIPNISNAISIIGAVSCHFCFTFPGLCFFCLYEKSPTSNKKHYFRKVGGIIYITLGMFFFGTNLTIAIQTLSGGTAIL